MEVVALEKEIEMPEFLQSLTKILNEYEFADENKQQVISEIIDKYYQNLKMQCLKKEILKPAPEQLKPAIRLQEEGEELKEERYNLFDDIKRKLKEDELRREDRKKQREEQREDWKNENREDNNLNKEENNKERNVNNDKVVRIKKEIYCEFVNLQKLYNQLYEKSKKANEKIIVKEMIDEIEGLLSEIKTFNVHTQILNNIECREPIQLPRGLCASYKRVFEYVTYLISKLNKLKSLDDAINVNSFITNIVVTLTVHQNKLNSLILNCIF